MPETGRAGSERNRRSASFSRMPLSVRAKVVPVGSLNRYASQHIAATPVYAGVGDLYGEGTLPARIGAGTNPFANTFETPRF